MSECLKFGAFNNVAPKQKLSQRALDIHFQKDCDTSFVCCGVVMEGQYEFGLAIRPAMPGRLADAYRRGTQPGVD